MLGFLEWYTMHNNWVSSVIFAVMFGFWMWSSATGCHWKVQAIVYTLLGLVFGGLIYVMVYIGGYGMYKRHWNTCTKPEAVASFYVFDAQKERCFKPVVGFAPVDDTTVKTLTPKQMETGEWL